MLPFGNISERIFTHMASHYACKHTTILAVWQGRKCRLRTAEPHPPFSFPRKKTGGVTVQKKGVCIASEQLEELRRLPNRVPAIFVAIRFDFLLSSLSLCLRFVTLTQSPSTLNFINLAFSCQGGFAALAAIYALSVDSD